MNNFIKHFLSCTPINAINTLMSKEIDSFVDLEKQREILESTVNSDLIKKYPIKKSYQRAFLKWFMNKIEEKDQEIYDGIYTAYCNLVSLTLDESSHYRHFLMGSDCISIKESINIISDGTTGLISWQGAIELAEWCKENRIALSGKIVLELGCGVGLTGLSVIKKCSPKKYIFTDCHKSVLDMVSENVQLNLLHENVRFDSRLRLQLKYNCTDVQVMNLKWEDVDEYVKEKWDVPDVIIGADILYDTDSFYTLISALKTFFSLDSGYAIIAATIRNVDTISQFLHQLEERNLCFEECTIPRQTIQTQLINSPSKIFKIFQGT
ncbi:protein-lysine N-methyltransferase EEF2KMT [Ceratina calcarata]|uniref:Protein-lysine N-methyltransferase EEF2KMT n=1 Tax=Ceratina calcarata TaxID=156304 RepID=A0AAJ7NCR5_9HYME|nr:protein-lysine N-methyltransferase EEF2KMT [Ceratina calcarata]